MKVDGKEFNHTIKETIIQRAVEICAAETAKTGQVNITEALERAGEEITKVVDDYLRIMRLLRVELTGMKPADTFSQENVASDVADTLQEG